MQNVEKLGGTHPVVYVAEGSHANYFRVVQGRLGLESDVVAADGPLLEPSVLTLTLLGEESPGLHLDAHRWLTYAGRWGDIGGEMDELAGRNGPLGPVYNSDGRKWHTPVVWALNLFLVDTTWFTASLLVANFNWIFLGVVGLFGGWKCWNIYRAASKKELVLGSLLRSKVSVGIGLGVVGLALTLAGMFLPWFTFSVNIPTGKFATQGPVNIIYLDGLNGLQINLLDASEGAMQLGGVGVSFSMIILVWLTFSFLDLIGTRNGKVLGRQHITSGIYNLIPIAVIVLFIMQFAMVVTSFAGAATGSVPLEARIIGDLISSSPMSGSYTGEIGAYGTASLSWGLGLGAYLLLIAGLVKIAAGSIIRVTSPPPKPQSKP